MSTYNYHLKKFGEVVSHAGMRYLSKNNVLARARRNDIVVKTMKEAKVALNKSAVDAELAGIVKACAEEFEIFTNFGCGPEHLADFLDTVQKKNAAKFPWAASLSGSTFLELFWRLMEARHEWTKSPAPPFDWAQHSPVAAEVDNFLSVMGLIRNDGYEWVEAEVMLYDMAGGFEADEDDTEGNLMKMPAVREALGGLEEENTAVEGEGMEEQEQEQQEDVSEDVEMMDVS